MTSDTVSLDTIATKLLRCPEIAPRLLKMAGMLAREAMLVALCNEECKLLAYEVGFRSSVRIPPLVFQETDSEFLVTVHNHPAIDPVWLKEFFSSHDIISYLILLHKYDKRIVDGLTVKIGKVKVLKLIYPRERIFNDIEERIPKKLYMQIGEKRLTLAELIVTIKESPTTTVDEHLIEKFIEEEIKPETELMADLARLYVVSQITSDICGNIQEAVRTGISFLPWLPEKLENYVERLRRERETLLNKYFLWTEIIL